MKLNWTESAGNVMAERVTLKTGEGGGGTARISQSSWMLGGTLNDPDSAQLMVTWKEWIDFRPHTWVQWSYSV